MGWLTSPKWLSTTCMNQPMTLITKTCACGAEFSVRRGSRRQRCVSCRRRARKAAIATSRRNRAAGKPPRVTRNLKSIRAVTADWIAEYLQANPCPCGERHMAQLRFVGPPGDITNIADINRMQRTSEALVNIQAAIAVARVLCVRCAATESFYTWRHDPAGYLRPFAGPPPSPASSPSTATVTVTVPTVPAVLASSTEDPVVAARWAQTQAVLEHGPRRGPRPR